MTPAANAAEIVNERSHLGHVADILASRVRSHRTMTTEEEQRAEANVRGRAEDLLDSWFKVAKRQRDTGSRLVYQSYENADGPALLHLPLDPELGALDADARKFKAPRSLRDVEPSVNLWVKTLDNVAIDMPPEGEES